MFETLMRALQLLVLIVSVLVGLWLVIAWFRSRYENSPENPDWHALTSELPQGSPLDEDIEIDPDPASTPAP